LSEAAVSERAMEEYVQGPCQTSAFGRMSILLLSEHPVWYRRAHPGGEFDLVHCREGMVWRPLGDRRLQLEARYEPNLRV